MKKQTIASLIAIVIALVLGAFVAIAGSVGGASAAGFPLFALAVFAAYLLQVVIYVPSVIARSERFFDLTGSATFIGVTVVLVVLVEEPDARVWVLAAMVVLWALRLGTFLFIRISRTGADDRFDDIKGNPITFLRVWVLQGAWVALTASAAWIAMTGAEPRPLGPIAFVGIAVWLVGIVIEIVADAQKSAFKADERNRGEFVSSGLWSRSRHPNYFGEILLWVGVFLVAAPVLSGWQWVALISPLFVALLLTRVSGIPLLEAKADKKWGGREDYERYKNATPVLIPRLTSSR